MSPSMNPRYASQVPGVLGARILRKLIRQLSDSITKNTPTAERRKILEKIMSLREELQAGGLLNQKYRESEQYKQKQARRAAKASERASQQNGQQDGVTDGKTDQPIND